MRSEMTKTKRHNTALPSANNKKDTPKDVLDQNSEGKTAENSAQTALPVEKGGPKGPEPTRYGDWEAKGRCTDF